jgi:hypothetical protein
MVDSLQIDDPYQPEIPRCGSRHHRRNYRQQNSTQDSTLRSVLDVAVDQIDEAHRTPATKAKMAERLLRAASDGVTDPVTLTEVAIEGGMQPAD